METRGMGHRQHQPVHTHQRIHRHFRWRTEEVYWTDEFTSGRSGFNHRTNRPIHKREHWAVRPYQAVEQAPERIRRHRHWAFRPRQADEYRRAGGEFRGRRIRDGVRQAQPGQQHHHRAFSPRQIDETTRQPRRTWSRFTAETNPGSSRNRHWAFRPRHADEYRHEGGQFQNRRIRDGVHQAHTSEHRHPSQILREKWALERKLFHITRRIQRLNHQLRG